MIGRFDAATWTEDDRLQQHRANEAAEMCLPAIHDYCQEMAQRLAQIEMLLKAIVGETPDRSH